jgi:hypothetical protein
MSVAAHPVQPRALFATAGEFIAALRRVPECYDPRTSSMLVTRRGRGGLNAEPFHAGFVTRFEERAEVIRLLHFIDSRSRRLLVLWFVEGEPVTRIARRLHISRVHCYRLKDQALRTMLQDGKGSVEAGSVSSEGGRRAAVPAQTRAAFDK